MTAHTSTSIPFSPLKLYFLNSLNLSASEGPVWCPLPLCNILSTNCYWSELRVILADVISYKYGSITRVKKKKKKLVLYEKQFEKRISGWLYFSFVMTGHYQSHLDRLRQLLAFQDQAQLNSLIHFCLFQCRLPEK